MRRRIRTLLSCLVLALPVAPATTAVAAPPDGPGPDQAGRLTRLWTAAPRFGTLGSSPVYARGSVYVSEDAYPRSDPRTGLLISRRDARTGRPLPFAAGAVPALLFAQPATDGVRVFTVSAYENSGATAQVRAYSLDGQSLWSRRVPGERFLLSVVVAGTLVITAGGLDCDRGEDVPCARTTVTAWRATSGRRVWDRTVEGSSPQLAAAAGRLAVATTEPRDPGAVADTVTVTALDLADGHPLWAREGLAAGPLAADADQVYLAAGSLCALRAADGHGRWCVGKDRYQDVTVAADGLYATAGRGGPDPRVVALDRTGRARWSSPASPTGPLTISGGVVYLQHYVVDGPVLPHPVDRPTHLLALHGTTGARLADLPVSDGYSSGSVAVGGGRVYTTADLTAVVGFAPGRR